MGPFLVGIGLAGGGGEAIDSTTPILTSNPKELH